jgi:dolichol-phosphate mannosyltransferase
VELSVVVPVHNEAENAARLLAEIGAALDGVVDYEVLFVDDGSTDGTPRRLTEAARSFPRLRVLRHARCCGQSAAIRTGVEAARAPWVATLDGDGQNDPADVPRLLELVRSDGGRRPDLIIGQRVARHDSFVRRLSSRIANGVRARLLRDATLDTGCGLKLFARDAFLALPFFDHMHRFLPALFLRRGARVRSVPVRHRPRWSGRSHYGVRNRLWIGIVDLFGVLWLLRRMARPEVTEVQAGSFEPRL